MWQHKFKLKKYKQETFQYQLHTYSTHNFKTSHMLSTIQFIDKYHLIYGFKDYSNQYIDTSTYIFYAKL